MDAMLNRMISGNQEEPLWRRVLPDAPGVVGFESLPLASVIVTAYNYERFIDPCLQSVAGQTYSKFECIVIDDASSDGTGERIRHTLGALDDERFRYIRNPTNLGQLGAQSTALRHCRGAFIVFLDADDTLAPAFLERHIFAQVSGRYPTGLSVSDQLTIDQDGAVHSGTRLNRDALAEVKTAKTLAIAAGQGASPLNVVFLPWRDAATHASYGWYWQTQSALVFRRSVLDLIMPLPEDCGSFRICADAYLARFAHLLANSLILLEPLGCYRQHAANNFSGPSFMSIDQQGGDMRVHPPHSAFIDLVRMTIRKRQKMFDARVGDYRIAQIMAAIGDQSDETLTPARKSWRLSLSRQ
ncbi:MAG: glycosyltransferase [Proteobacteria bacterium]|nr:glycosyltransferase [Pseudomonadota bacterium]